MRDKCAPSHTGQAYRPSIIPHVIMGPDEVGPPPVIASEARQSHCESRIPLWDGRTAERIVQVVARIG